MQMTDADDQKLLYEIYEERGADGVDRWARRPVVAARVRWRNCTVCDGETPHVGPECAVWGAA